MATKVFIVDRDYKADYKVYFVELDYKEKNAAIISGGQLVNRNYKADVKVFIVDRDYKANILITHKHFPK